MLLDLRLVAERPLFVLGIAAGVIVTKTILISLINRLFGSRLGHSLRLGLLREGVSGGALEEGFCAAARCRICI